MPLFTWSYWFSLQPSELMPAVKLGLLVAFAALFALGIVASLLARKADGRMALAEGGARFSRLALWMGTFGLLLLLFTHELTYFFGARFWYLVWLLLFLIQIVRLAKFLMVDVPEKRAAFAERARIRRWLPQHHKK